MCVCGVCVETEREWVTQNRTRRNSKTWRKGRHATVGVREIEQNTTNTTVDRECSQHPIAMRQPCMSCGSVCRRVIARPHALLPPPVSNTHIHTYLMVVTTRIDSHRLVSSRLVFTFHFECALVSAIEFDGALCHAPDATALHCAPRPRHRLHSSVCHVRRAARVNGTVMSPLELLTCVMCRALQCGLLTNQPSSAYAYAIHRWSATHSPLETKGWTTTTTTQTRTENKNTDD